MEGMKGSRRFIGWSVMEFTTQIRYILNQALITIEDG
jgi:hypothetical protein